jgi:hypothetical protein
MKESSTYPIDALYAEYVEGTIVSTTLETENVTRIVIRQPRVFAESLTPTITTTFSTLFSSQAVSPKSGCQVQELSFIMEDGFDKKKIDCERTLVPEKIKSKKTTPFQMNFQFK